MLPPGLTGEHLRQAAAAAVKHMETWSAGIPFAAQDRPTIGRLAEADRWDTRFKFYVRPPESLQKAARSKRYHDGWQWRAKLQVTISDGEWRPGPSRFVTAEQFAGDNPAADQYWCSVYVVYEDHAGTFRSRRDQQFDFTMPLGTLKPFFRRLYSTKIPDRIFQPMLDKIGETVPDAGEFITKLSTLMQLPWVFQEKKRKT